jgi:hypothetical protein
MKIPVYENNKISEIDIPDGAVCSFEMLDWLGELCAFIENGEIQDDSVMISKPKNIKIHSIPGYQKMWVKHDGVGNICFYWGLTGKNSTVKDKMAFYIARTKTPIKTWMTSPREIWVKL